MLNTIRWVLKVREPDINRVSDTDGLTATIKVMFFWRQIHEQKVISAVWVFLHDIVIRFQDILFRKDS